MSRKYKFNDKNGVYFISFATVYWIDVFVRDCYFETMMSALNYCRENKRIEDLWLLYYAKSCTFIISDRREKSF